jgi:hypothetical protein
MFACLTRYLIQTRFIGNVWRIHENDNILYIQVRKILKYLNGKYTAIDGGSQKLNARHG